MRDEIIKFETAVLAKEKGFNIRVKPFYNGLQDNKLEVSDIIGSSNQLSNWYPAPTQSLLQKWLREVHNIECYVFPYKDHGDDVNDPIKYRGYRSGMKVFNTFEEALEKDLFEALKLIKS